MRTLNNLLIIALIGLFSSTYLINLSPIDYKGSIEIETPTDTSTLSLSTESSRDLLNPESIVIEHLSEKTEILGIVTPNVFVVNVFENGNLILDNLTYLEEEPLAVNSQFSIEKDHPLSTKLNISQKKLGLKDGTYEMVFQSNLIAQSENSTISITVTYDTGGSYYPAINTTPTGTKGLTLYFTTENADTLIPVTRFVVEDKSITRMAIEQLQNGPLDEGLFTVIGDVTNTTYNNGNVVIDLPSSYTEYNSESTGGTLSYNAFIKTIFAIDKYWPIYSLSFTVDRENIESYFNGIDNLNSIPNEDGIFSVYLAFKINDRYYLFDKTVGTKLGINKSDSPELNAQKLFDSYNDTEFHNGINPIPTDVILNGATLEGTTLKLDFSEEFLDAYDENDNLKYMMIESLIYTFTSIPSVEGIQITVNQNPLVDFIKDRDLAGILYPPLFINPEQAEQSN
jgi:spore germination protein GerM